MRRNEAKRGETCCYCPLGLTLQQSLVRHAAAVHYGCPQENGALEQSETNIGTGESLTLFAKPAATRK